MKELSDGTQVTSRSYYFLLDFNDRDSWKTIMKEFNVQRLYDLNKSQYIKLFEIATKAELQILKTM
jgi:hypothetical protein